MESTTSGFQEAQYKKLLQRAATNKDYRQLCNRLWSVFTQPDVPSECMQLLSKSFQVVQPQQSRHNVQLPFLLTFYSDLVAGRTGDPALVLTAMRHMMKFIASNPKLREQHLRMLFVFLLNPQLMERPGWQHFSELVNQLSVLSEPNRSLLAKWLTDLEPERLYRLLYGAESVLSELVEAQQRSRQINYSNEMIVFCRLIEQLFRSNQMAPRINNRVFRNAHVNHYYKPDDEYVMYLQGRRANRQVCWLDFPFLLNTDFKNQLIELEVNIEQSKHVEHGLNNMFIGLFSSLQQGLAPRLDMMGAMFLSLEVRRNFILDDSVDRLANIQSNLRNPLKITFIGEPGKDGGGLKNEYFQLVVKQIFNPNRDMFVGKNDNRFHWFNQFSFEEPQMFYVIGMILGLAIYNTTLLELKFPLIVYQKLLAPENYHFEQLEELKQVEPDFYKSFSYILQTNEPLESMELTFEADCEHYGERSRKPLVPNGNRIGLCQQNKYDYVKLYTKWLLNGSVEKQFLAFRRGFYRVVQSKLIQKMFLPEELEEVICGSPVLDFRELEKAAQYEGFAPNSQFVKALWALLNSYNEEMKKAFLFFVTGTDRAPIGGLSRVSIIIQKQGPDSNSLPSAQTCSGVLLIPEYRSHAKLKSKMELALKHKEGFGMQ